MSEMNDRGGFAEIFERLRSIERDFVELSDMEPDYLVERFAKLDEPSSDELERLAIHHAFMALVNMKAFEALVYLREQKQGWDQHPSLEKMTEEFTRMVGAMEWVDLDRIDEDKEAGP